MPRDYSWAARSTPPGWYNIGDVAEALGVGRHAALRRLKKSGLPAKRFTRRWRGENGKNYVRRFWATPHETVFLLMFGENQRRWGRFARLGIGPYPMALSNRIDTLRAHMVPLLAELTAYRPK